MLDGDALENQDLKCPLAARGCDSAAGQQALDFGAVRFSLFAAKAVDQLGERDALPATIRLNDQRVIATDLAQRRPLAVKFHDGGWGSAEPGLDVASVKLDGLGGAAAEQVYQAVKGAIGHGAFYLPVR
jgi:hypothetical protein